MYRPHREQARLPPGFFGTHRFSIHPQSIVGASLLAIAVGQLASGLNVPPSSRASSAPTWVLRYPQIQHPPTIHCGSELARDSSGSACIGIECADVIASKLGSHMGSSVPTDSASAHNPLWELSLLAIAVGQLASGLNVLTSSRASSAPTWVLRYPQIQHPPTWGLGDPQIQRPSTIFPVTGFHIKPPCASHDETQGTAQYGEPWTH